MKNSIIKSTFKLSFYFILLSTTISCLSNSTSATSINTQKAIGDFPLKINWWINLENKVKAMALNSNVLTTGIINNETFVVESFDLETGSSLWVHQFPGDEIGNITTSNGVVYVISTPELIAMDIDNGNLIFENDIQGSSLDRIVLVSDKHIFIIRISQGVYVYDKFNGELSWQFPLGRGGINVFSDNDYNLIYIVHGEDIWAVDEGDGTIVWQKQIGDYGAMKSYNGKLYFSSSRDQGNTYNYLQSADLDTKEIEWEIKLDSEIECVEATSTSVFVITAQTVNKFDKLSGNKIWGYYISPDIYCPPVITDDVIYLKDGSANQIIAISQEDGNVLGRLDFEDSNWFGYEIPNDNLGFSGSPYSLLVFYVNNFVYVYK